MLKNDTLVRSGFDKLTSVPISKLARGNLCETLFPVGTLSIGLRARGTLALWRASFDWVWILCDSPLVVKLTRRLNYFTPVQFVRRPAAVTYYQSHAVRLTSSKIRRCNQFRIARLSFRSHASGPPRFLLHYQWIAARRIIFSSTPVNFDTSVSA